MSGAVRLTPEAAEVANRISAIDVELDALNERIERVNGVGLRGGRFIGWHAHEAEDRLDDTKAPLLAERSELAAKLKALIEASGQ